jgi:glucose-6-phosphate isomerase
MNEHFRTAAPADNIVLNYTAVGNLASERLGMNLRVLSAWANALEATGLWYDQLLAESLGKAERGATPLTVVNTRDLHSRAQQHQEGCRDKMITNLIVGEWRFDSVEVTASDNNQDRLNAIAGRTVPEIMAAAISGTNQAYREVGRPTADLVLPTVDEAALGQLMQMLMLATVVEGRLMGINPYGQPGVEAYKRHMMKHLDLV